MEYLEYSEYLKRFFGDVKVQKISVNMGSGCPNRDGTIGTGGCIYCNNESFTPQYCFEHKSVREQIEAGKEFFGRKYPSMKYLAYFQSFTNTYGKSCETLEETFLEALDTPDILGIIVGTRPDCIDDKTMEMLARINRRAPVFVELGVETMCDNTLHIINRGHDSRTSRCAIEKLAKAGLHVGVHLIAGLPGEDEARILQTLDEICALPVESIKLHHLQILKGTALERMWQAGEIEVKCFEAEEYMELCLKMISRIPKHICIERFLASAPPNLVISPKWGMKNHEFTSRLKNRMQKIPT